MELVLTQFICNATTMESHFFIILILLQGGAQSEGAQLHHRVLALLASHSFTPSARPLSPSLWVFLFFPRSYNLLPVSNHSSTSVLPACPVCLSLFDSFLSFSFSPHSLSGCFHSHRLVYLALFPFGGHAVKPLGYIWSGR